MDLDVEHFFFLKVYVYYVQFMSVFKIMVSFLAPVAAEECIYVFF